MAEGFFDNRYRYDYIYPRGRSGETLRAVDTQDSDRPVVIKRPAPQDAPPIRAGQEVSILNERKALTRLAGHPVATALLGGGQFTVGGMAHQYIVMERAEGLIVADMVSELTQRGERLPDLEMLIIVDALLDLLYAAHQHDIVYNDVDAKHLFWDRDRYRLKIIDWGNAVFLEGDEVTAQGISRQTDVYQVGELLYFILTGGGRADVPRDAADGFRIDFGHDAEHISERLAAIISRALHPNPRLRTSSITELRRDLSEVRLPLERERSAVVSRASERLRRELSKDELIGLQKAVEPALSMDPGYPPARQVVQEILNRQGDLEVAADLDAARIYLESGAWARAIPILDELRPRARGDLAALIGLLTDWARLITDAAVPPAAAVYDSVPLLFEGHQPEAAHRLLTEVPADANAHSLNLLLAERISAHTPEILLLRPNLFRLELALSHLAADGISVGEAQAFLRDIYRDLDALGRETGGTSMIALRDGYRALVDQMTALNKFLGTVRMQHQLTNRRLPQSSLDRAINATMAVADNMHIIGKQATGSPRDAMNALENSRAIDPTNRAWDGVRRLLDQLYDLLQSYQTYVPAADGSDLASWLVEAQRDLAPFLERLFDEMLVGMTLGLKLAASAWEQYGEAAVRGSRGDALTALAQAVDAISTVSPALAGWLNQLRSVVNNAGYIERHAMYGGLGRALADGWEQFDRGRLANAEQLGGQALEIARTDTERDSARRLRDLTSIMRDWVERSGIADRVRTQATLMQIESLYTADEIAQRNAFNAQIPGKDTYLKAMFKGLIEPLARRGTAGVRILFANYALLGALDAHDSELDDADFWRQAGAGILGNTGNAHPFVTALEGFIQRRRDLQAAGDLLNSVNGSHALSTLERSRTALEENTQARLLAPAIYSLREITASLRDWSDGEFRAAGNKLENALRAVDEVESTAGVTLTAYRAWLMDLVAGAAELHNNSRKLNQLIERRDPEPQPAVLQIHREQVATTDRLLGAAYSGTQRLWLDTYEKFLAAYHENARRSVRLSRFNDLFRAMFIDRHPAYPLYRHWYDLIEQSSEFPAPPTQEPVPAITEAEDESVEPKAYVRVDPDDDLQEGKGESRRGGGPPIGLILVLLVVLLAIAGGAVLLSRTGGVSDPTPSSASAGGDSTAAAVAAAPTETPIPSEEPPTLPPTTPAPTVAATLPRATTLPTVVMPSLALPTQEPTLTPILPTETPTITATPSQTLTPTSTSTPTATLPPTHTLTPSPPPGGLRGDQNLFVLLDSIRAPYWDAESFSPAIEDSAWRLGSGSAGPAGEILIPLAPDLLEGRYGADPAQRIMRMVAELELVTYNPPLVLDQGVYFGILLSDPSSPANGVGIQISLAQQGVFNIGQRRDGVAEVNVQRSVGAPVARIRLERDLTSGLLAMYVNDEQIGTPIRLSAPTAPLIPVLFVRSGGVIIHVNRWQVTLR
ncbi:MAG: hypothetical protein IPK19_19715 [Chloroflexi bacterium]|nr:hypothetical protein [Chloroflexota bacterium]